MKQVTLGQEKFYPIQLSQNAKINELLIQWKADTGMGPKSRSQQNLSIKKDDSKTELVQVKSSNNLAYASDSRSTTASSSRLLRKVNFIKSNLIYIRLLNQYWIKMSRHLQNAFAHPILILKHP